MKRTLLTLLVVCLAGIFWGPQSALAEEGASSLEEGPPVRRLLLLRSGRFELQPQVAFSLNDPFVRNIGVGASAAYYFNNALGIGADFHFAPIHMDTDETSAVQTPDYSPRVKEQLRVSQLMLNFDAGMIWAPIFGKFNLFGLILNYDFHLFGGAGVLILEGRCADEGTTCTENETIEGPKFAGALGFGARIYFNNFVALNLELRDYMTSFADYSRKSTDDYSEFQNYFVGAVGVSIFFPLEVYVSR